MIHKENILKLHAEGKSYRQIQEILGCSKGTIAYHLGKGQREKTRSRTTRSRTLAKRKIWDIKEESGCVDCKEKYPHYMLDFDHLPEFQKIDSPTQMIHKYSWEKAVEEMSKCDIVCANCHKIRTWNRYLDSIGL
jgi:transposase